jgi:hypothetical protein
MTRMLHAAGLAVLALPALVAVAHAQGTEPLQPLPPPAPSTTGPATPADFGAAPAPAPTQAPAAAPAAVVVTPAPAPSAAEDEAKARAFRPSFKGALGYQYAHTFGVPIEAGRLRLGVGGQNDWMAHYLMLSIMVGETDAGRRAWDMRVGWSGDFRVVSILRLGLDAEVGYLFFRRATIDERMYALGIGAGAHVGVDAFTWGERDDHALFVEGRIEGHIHFGSADLWGPSILLGLRY